MKRSKDLFMEMMESLMWGLFIPQEQKEEKVHTETHEIVKGNYKTNFEYLFNEQGELLGHKYTQEYIPSKEEELKNQQLTLQQQLEQALQEEDYKKAAAIHKQQLELKPTQ